MIQFYFVSVLFLFITALMKLFDFYSSGLLFLLGVKQKLAESSVLRLIFCLVGIVTSLILLFFPTDPGPVFIGDLIPSITIFIEASKYLFYSDRYSQKIKNSEKNKILGYYLLLLAFAHFLFPSGVLI